MCILLVKKLDSMLFCVRKVKKSKRSIAVSDSPHRYGNSHAIWDHTVLPAPGRGDIPARPRVRKYCGGEKIL